MSERSIYRLRVDTLGNLTCYVRRQQETAYILHLPTHHAEDRSLRDLLRQNN